VQHYAVFGEELYGAAQDSFFDFGPCGAHAVYVVAVVNGFGVLDDDRSFIEVVGHEVGRSADDLHASIMRLLIGIGSDKGWQEGMVNVDEFTFKLGNKTRGEDSHEFRQDNIVCLIA